MFDHNLYSNIRDYFTEKGQEHIFEGFEELSDQAKRQFLAQLEAMDYETVEKQFELYSQSSQKKKRNIRPAETIGKPRNNKEISDFRKARNRGEELLRTGKVAAFLVAGGQGTRLGLPGPKGTFPVYPITGRSLFEIFALKLQNLRHRYGKSIPLYIMTNPDNDDETRAYFTAFNFFGLDPDNVGFLVQKTLPSLDLWGKLLVDRPGHVFESPNGHGGAIDALVDAGIVRNLLDRGFEELFYFQVDNALVRICDPVFIGFHSLRRADVSTKVVSKTNPGEKVGIVGYIDGKPGVIEYSEMSFDELRERRKDGRLRYNAGNTAIHTFSLEFLDNFINGGYKLPYHNALKKVALIDGPTVEAVKFERFIFDTMAFAGRVTVFEANREDEFSPLKNAVGVDSPNSVRNALQRMWGRWLIETGIDVPLDKDGLPCGLIEISPMFADSADELKAKLPSGWKFRDGVILG